MTDRIPDHVARYEGIIGRFIAWAVRRPDVKAAFVVGSRARTVRPADEWSDLDVVMFADEPELLLEDPEWLNEMGDWDISFREPTAVGIWEERRVLFANGADGDFSILPARFIDEMETMQPGDFLHQQAANVVARGYRVLVDKGGRLAPILSMMASTAPPRHAPPTQAELDQMLADFWYHCPWTARKLRRGELAVAHECLNGNQRTLLLRLIRWLSAGTTDTWHGTRYLEEWSPDPVYDHYARTFAQHDARDIVRALREMMDLVSSLGQQIASAYGLEIDPRPEAAARRWTAAILGDGP